MTNKIVILFSILFSIICHQASIAYEIGIIDKYRLLTEYKESKEAQERIVELRTKIQELLLTLNKEIEEASKNKKLSESELAAKQKEAEKKLLDEKAKAESIANSLRQDVEGKIREIIDEEAKSQKLDLIITAETAYYGGKDITDSILKKLNSK
ncbi:MAG: OmpH family outer membrane protein [Candidatus Caenarcaniphilales bacterium]|nr:OmpH family outer membrane protein [Candidatus Caenarcaniphilales bacterium]